LGKGRGNQLMHGCGFLNVHRANTNELGFLAENSLYWIYISKNGHKEKKTIRAIFLH